MKTVGFAGTAKNTGKTTTTLAVLEQVRAARIPTALTSIGYDGENQDQVTGLSKPRFFLEQGMLVATAEECLRAGTARIEVVEPTSIRTGLGDLQIGVVRSAGTVLVAGPNRSSDLRILIARLKALGAQLALVDGALNRLVPLIYTDGLVISTGAALDTRIEVIAGHAAALHTVLNRPVQTTDLPSDRISVAGRGRRAVEIIPGSLLGERVQAEVMAALQWPVETLVIPGACDPLRLEALVDAAPACLEGALLVFGSPLKLIASGGPQTWARLFERLSALSIQITYLENVPVTFQTVNPFYPRYLFRPGEYEAAYIDKLALLTAVRAALPGITVLDILQPPPPDLLALLHVTQEGAAHVS